MPRKPAERAELFHPAAAKAVEGEDLLEEAQTEHKVAKRLIEDSRNGESRYASSRYSAKRSSAVQPDHFSSCRSGP